MRGTTWTRAALASQIAVAWDAYAEHAAGRAGRPRPHPDEYSGPARVRIKWSAVW